MPLEDVPLLPAIFGVLLDCEVPADMPPFAFVLTFALPPALPLTLGLELMLFDIEFIAPLACDWALLAVLIAASVAVFAAPMAVPATSGGGLLLPLPVLTEALPEAEPEPDTATLLPFWLVDMLAEGVLVDGALLEGVSIGGALVAAELTTDPSVVAAAFSAGPPGVWDVGGTGLSAVWPWVG